MLAANLKIAKSEGVTELDQKVAQALYELQANSEKLKHTLREVQIHSARELDLGNGKTALLIFVPVPQMPLYQKMIKERSLLEELEKKFSGRQVVIIGQRRIIRKESRNLRQLKQKRPRSRTLTAVHDAILEDLVHPCEITGRRIRFRPDGSRLFKVFLHSDSKVSQDKLDTYARVYKALTSKDTVFTVTK